MFPILHGTIQSGGSALPSWAIAGGAPVPLMVCEAQGAATKAAALLDLSGNGNDAAETGAPTWTTADGFAGFSDSDYLTTGLVANHDQSWSMLVVFKNHDLSTDCSTGSHESGTQQFGVRHGGFFYTFDNGTDASQPGAEADGVLAVSGTSGYWHDSAGSGVVGGIGAYSPASNSTSIHIGHSNALFFQPWIGAIAAWAIWDDNGGWMSSVAAAAYDKFLA